MPEFELPTKRIIVEFIGGDADGKVYDSESADPSEAQYAGITYIATEGGTIGRGVRSMPLAMKEELRAGNTSALKGYHPHEYRIVDRTEDENEIRIRMQYKGQVVPESS